MNTNLRKEAKTNFEKTVKLMNNVVFWKTMENVKNYLVSKPNYHTALLFTKDLLAAEMIKTKIFLNNPTSLGLSIVESSKTIMSEFWYDYVKLKYCEIAKILEKNTKKSIIQIGHKFLIIHTEYC